MARELTPSLGVSGSDLSLNELALVLSVQTTPEGAHRKSAAFLLDDRFVGSVTKCLRLLEVTGILGLDSNLVRFNISLVSGGSHLPADLHFVLGDISRSSSKSSVTTGALLGNNSGSRSGGDAGLRSSLNLEVRLGPGSPAEHVLGTDSVQVEGLVGETTVVPVEVGSDAVLSRNPSGLGVSSPLNFKLSN